MTLEGEVKEWLPGAWTSPLTLRAWWWRLAEVGYAQPTWPAPYGWAATSDEARAITEQLAAAGTIAPPEGGVGVGLAAPTLFEHGSEDQLARFLPPLLRGEESWCQLFSEPGAGSDLPSLTTRATRDGDGWRVSGQKVWSSNAHVARRGLLLARTDPDEPGRAGISYFVLDMAQPGVEVRPIRQMNGRSAFCEVFLDGARVSDADLVGTVGDGWRVARTTLAHERANTSRRPARGLTFVASGEAAGQLDRVVDDLLAAADQAPAFNRRALPARQLAALAREHGGLHAPAARDRLTRYLVLTEVHRLNQLRSPRVDPSITKLLVSQICHVSRETSYAVFGAASMLDGIDAPLDGQLHAIGLGSFGVSIGGGTDEIQRNQLAERVLGLPRDSRPTS